MPLPGPPHSSLGFKSPFHLCPSCVTWGKSHFTSLYLTLCRYEVKVIISFRRGLKEDGTRQSTFPCTCPCPASLEPPFSGSSNPRYSPLHTLARSLQQLPNQHSTHITLPCTTPLSLEDTGSVATATGVLPPTLFNNFSTVELGWLGVKSSGS